MQGMDWMMLLAVAALAAALSRRSDGARPAVAAAAAAFPVLVCSLLCVYELFLQFGVLSK